LSLKGEYKKAIEIEKEALTLFDKENTKKVALQNIKKWEEKIKK